MLFKMDLQKFRLKISAIHLPHKANTLSDDGLGQINTINNNCVG